MSNNTEQGDERGEAPTLSFRTSSSQTKQMPYRRYFCGIVGLKKKKKAALRLRASNM